MKKGLYGFALAGILLISPVSAAGSLRVGRVTTESVGQGFKFHCSYPRIDGLHDETVEQTLNVKFKEDALCALKAAENASKSAEVNGIYDFKITRNTGGLVSLAAGSTVNYPGRAFHDQKAFTISTVTGKKLLLPDLFIKNADYVGVLSDEIRSQTTKKRIASKQAVFKQISENENYYLTNDSIVIFFSQGRYFDSTNGVPEFVIPLKTLDGILRPELRLLD